MKRAADLAQWMEKASLDDKRQHSSASTSKGQKETIKESDECGREGKCGKGNTQVPMDEDKAASTEDKGK